MGWGCCHLFIMMFLITCNAQGVEVNKDNNKPIKEVLLLGASVGEAWNFEALPARLQKNEYSFEFKAKYEPDKTDILEQALNRKENKPDAIIIKQCAAYFRGDSMEYMPEHVQRYKQLLVDWVDNALNREVTPILATVVPITEKLPFMTRIKRAIKKYILQKKVGNYYRATRLEGIIDYNDWLKKYAKEKKLLVLDLESAVRVNKENRYLDIDFTTDGLHLNKKAYRKLDQIVLDTLINKNFQL